MSENETRVAAGWLVLATLPAGERYIVVPPDGDSLDFDDARVLARAIDWHSGVHAVGEVVPLWRAVEAEPTDTEEERCHLPSPWARPTIYSTGNPDTAETELVTPAIGRPVSSSVYFLVDGKPYSGTAADYVRAHELAQLDVITVPDVVWTWNVVLQPFGPGGANWGWRVHFVDVRTEAGDDSHTTVTLRFLDHKAQYRHLTR
jgi:hypothetical protein